MAHDVARERMVLFGGNDPGRLGDTWEWDGESWTQRTPATNPPPRNVTAMAYDAARQRVVLFGGNDGSARRLNDTWEWDGVNWMLRTPATCRPTPRYQRAVRGLRRTAHCVNMVAPSSTRSLGMPKGRLPTPFASLGVATVSSTRGA
jgi:hypothetical protein